MQRQLLASYLRTHLIGASGGIRLAEILAADPWTEGALDPLPGELADEVAYVRAWVSQTSGWSEGWIAPTFGATALARSVISPLRPLRGTYRRAFALETMRSLVLAKKAMWELGTALAATPELEKYDAQAARQADDLQVLHRRAVQDAFRAR